MQILHPFMGSVQNISRRFADPDRYRPDHCPQCEAHRTLTAHGFYSRTLVEVAFDGAIRVRRHLCCCKRTVSLPPDFALPYLRFGITVIALFLIVRLLGGSILSAAVAAKQPDVPYQRGGRYYPPVQPLERNHGAQHTRGTKPCYNGKSFCPGRMIAKLYRVAASPLRLPLSPCAGVVSDGNWNSSCLERKGSYLGDAAVARIDADTGSSRFGCGRAGWRSARHDWGPAVAVSPVGAGGVGTNVSRVLPHAVHVFRSRSVSGSAAAHGGCARGIPGQFEQL